MVKIITKKELAEKYQIEIWPDHEIEDFQQKLLAWYDQEKRELPWRLTKDPYKIWVSEIMLQQTQVDTVLSYFKKFTERFPTVEDLAAATEQEVLKYWEGLGYYSRARNLHAAAQQVVTDYSGKFPTTFDGLQKLKGIGPYTAGAIASIAFGQPTPAVDGNVMRVMSRLFEINLDIKQAKNRKVFYAVTYHLMDKKRPGDFNQALMDLGATIMTPRRSRPELSPVKAFDQSYLNDSWMDYPVVSRNRPPRPQQYIALAIRNQAGELLLVQRPDTGLLASMWTFPMISFEKLMTIQSLKIEKKMIGSSYYEPKATDKSVIEDYFKKQWGSSIEIDLSRPKYVEHIFTHRIWHLTVLEGRLKTDALIDDSNVTWLAEQSQFNLPIPTVQQKMLDVL